MLELLDLRFAIELSAIRNDHWSMSGSAKNTSDLVSSEVLDA